ncbi:hypothetical protein Plhal703r1_c71g0171171 [Plasmopara halstedii]
MKQRHTLNRWVQGPELSRAFPLPWFDLVISYVSSRKLAAFTKFLHPSTQSDLLAALKLNGKPTGTSSRKTTEGVNNREGYHKCNLGEMFNKVFPAQTVESLSPKRSQATTRPCLSLLSVDHCPPLYSKQSASDLEVIDIER